MAKFAALPGLREPMEQRTGPNDLVYPVTCSHSRQIKQLTFEVCTDIGPCVQVVIVQHGFRTCMIVPTGPDRSDIDVVSRLVLDNKYSLRFLSRILSLNTYTVIVCTSNLLHEYG
jgi:hypothetical protein